jgi:hypothetical protein
VQQVEDTDAGEGLGDEAGGEVEEVGEGVGEAESGGVPEEHGKRGVCEYGPNSTSLPVIATKV